MVNYNKEFIDVIQFSKNNDLYLGTGNPSSNILIIGKEAAIDASLNHYQYEIEFKNNLRDWESNHIDNKQWSDIKQWSGDNYNPLYPYKGQKKTVESRDSSGLIKNGAGGTSRTWYYYQKLIDSILNNEDSDDGINFHENCFITELNQVTGSYSHTIPENLRMMSIEERKVLLQQDFFQRFPIVIVAVGHYVRDFNVDLETLFNVQFQDETLDLGSNNWINVHYQKDGNAPKLLIHTNQLSMIKNDLILSLAGICKGFISKNHS